MHILSNNQHIIHITYIILELQLPSTKNGTSSPCVCCEMQCSSPFSFILDPRIRIPSKLSDSVRRCSVWTALHLYWSPFSFILDPKFIFLHIPFIQCKRMKGLDFGSSLDLSSLEICTKVGHFTFSIQKNQFHHSPHFLCNFSINEAHGDLLMR